MRDRLGALRAPLHVIDFRRVWAAQVTSDLGDSAGRIALAVLMTVATGSALGAGAVLTVSVLPYLGLGQWLTAWAERFQRRTVLVSADLLRAGCYLLMAVTTSNALRLVLLFVASLGTPAFNSVRNALVPKILQPDRVADGFALQVLTNETARVVGLVAGGVGAAVLNARVALAANAVSFLLSAFILRRLGDAGDADRDRHTPVVLSDGWRAIRRDRTVRRIAWMAPVFVAFGSVPEALAVPFAAEDLGRSSAVAGVLSGLVSASILIAAPLIPRPSDHRALVRQAASLAFVGSLGAAGLFALAARIDVSAAAFFLIGPIFVGRVNLGAVQSQRVEDRLRASSFSVVEGYVAVGQVLAGVGGGAIADQIGTRPTFVAAMGATAAAAAIARWSRLPAHAAVSSEARG